MAYVEIQENIEELFEKIVEDYQEWTFNSYQANGYASEGIEDRVIEFQDGLIAEDGRKYIRILADNGRRVWGFVVKSDTNKFRAGDILKAASYKAPAVNKARGNILDGGYTVRWTGPLYL